MTDQLRINLAPQIRAAFLDCEKLASQTREFAAQAVAKALECGQLLIRQKESLGYGSWLEWLDANVPEICERTARHYMALAKRQHVADLSNAASVRQAYLAAGIIPRQESEAPAQPDPDKPWVRYVRFVDGFRLWFNKRMEEDALDTWPENARRVLKNDIRWIAELYQRL
jgi:Protein of unknown function (DUF3102)